MIPLSLTDESFHRLSLASDIEYPIQYATPLLQDFETLLADHALLFSERNTRVWRRSLLLDPAMLHEARQARAKLSRGTVRIRVELLRHLLMDHSQMLNELHGEWDLTPSQERDLLPDTEEGPKPPEEDIMAKEKTAKTTKPKAAKAAKPKATKTEGGNIAANYEYEKTKIKTADGKSKTVVDNGDRVATFMRGSDEKQLKAVAKENSIDWDPSKYKNPGLARMAFGNRLRALVRNPDVKVTIDGKAVASL